MGKLITVLMATAAILVAGSMVWKAEATTPGSDANLPLAAKNFSPVLPAGIALGLWSPRALLCAPC